MRGGCTEEDFLMFEKKIMIWVHPSVSFVSIHFENHRVVLIFHCQLAWICSLLTFGWLSWSRYSKRAEQRFAVFFLDKLKFFGLSVCLPLITNYFISHLYLKLLLVVLMALFSIAICVLFGSCETPNQLFIRVVLTHLSLCFLLCTLWTSSMWWH